MHFAFTSINFEVVARMIENGLISIVVGVRDRHHLLPRLISSLKEQAYSKWELLIVDQSLIPMIVSSDWSDSRIKIIKSDVGLSRARNVGLQEASGEFVCFLDDDCWLEKNSLSRAVQNLRVMPQISGLIGRVKTENGKIFRGITKSHYGPLTKWELLTASLSVGIFLRAIALEKKSLRFNESLGLGAPTEFQSGEEADLLLRLYEAGETIYQSDEYVVFHPSDTSLASLERIAAEGLTFGRLMKIHNFSSIILVLVSFLSGVLSILHFVSAKPSLGLRKWIYCKSRWKGYFSATTKEADM